MREVIEEFKMEFTVSAEEARKVIVCLLAIGAKPELVFEAIAPRIETLTDYRRDLDEVYRLIKPLEPYIAPPRLLALINGAVSSSDERIFINLWLERKKDLYAHVFDPVHVFLATALWRSDWTHEHFVEILDELGIEANDLLRQLNAETWYNVYEYYGYTGGRLKRFFIDVKAAGGDISRFADRLTNYCQFGFDSHQEKKFATDALRALVATEADEVYMDRICPDRELRQELLKKGR
ncbi:hypothetical protein IJI91_02780 [Candidatus Saccharibacteria bacterium]|nr:hypothetical protein [Candidatus Saccharibacteria bacterium]